MAALEICGADVSVTTCRATAASPSGLERVSDTGESGFSYAASWVSPAFGPAQRRASEGMPNSTRYGSAPESGLSTTAGAAGSGRVPASSTRTEVFPPTS